MRFFRRKILAVAGALFTLLAVALAAHADAPGSDVEATQSATPRGRGLDRGGDKKKGQKKGGETTSSSSLASTVLKGYPSKGLKIPHFDEEGNLQMSFEIGVATRLDDEQLRMDAAQLETFEDGEREMIITLPSAVLNLNSWEITSERPVSIQRSDFELTGQTMTFNTKTKQGKFGGGVRMVIFNLDSPEGDQPGTP